MDSNGQDHGDGLYATGQYRHSQRGARKVGASSDQPSNWLSTCPTDVLEELKGGSKTLLAAYHYLSELPVTLWAEWEIAKPDRRLEAAKWLSTQILAVLNQYGYTIAGTYNDAIDEELDQRLDKLPPTL